MEPIAFFGLGTMGEGIAANLVRAGYPVHITLNRNNESVERLVKLGAMLCDSKQAATKRSTIIVLCLPNSDSVSVVIDEISPVLEPRHLVIDTGTSSLSQTAQLVERLAAHKIELVESPVAGGKAQAAAAELGAFVGCSVAAFERVKPLLDCFCAAVQHFGPIGSGGRAKLVSN